MIAVNRFHLSPFHNLPKEFAKLANQSNRPASANLYSDVLSLACVIRRGEGVPAEGEVHLQRAEETALQARAGTIYLGLLGYIDPQNGGK